MLRPTVWLYATGAPNTYTDRSDNVRINTTFDFLSASTEYLYVGCDRRILGLYVDLSTNGSYGALTFEYLNSLRVWTKLSLIDSYAFNLSKYVRWALPNKDWNKFNFTATDPHTATPPDDVERYWMRISAASVTTKAVISKLRAIPFVEYTDVDKISDFLSVKKRYDNSTRPTDLAIESLIRRAEDRIDYRTRKSWRFNVVTEDTDPVNVDFGRSGMYMRHKNFYKVYSVKVWNGAEYATLTEGRTNEFVVDYNLGLIYLTRTYILPAVYGIAGRYTSYNVGEYKNAVRVDYAYGRDPETDPEFYVVEDLATKMVAVDIIRHHDYSLNTVSGSDKVSLSDKISNLEEEIEMRLDELTGVAII